MQRPRIIEILKTIENKDPKIKFLDLSNEDSLQAQDLINICKALAQNPYIKTLRLKHDINALVAEALVANRTIQYLDISNCQFTDFRSSSILRDDPDKNIILPESEKGTGLFEYRELKVSAKENITEEMNLLFADIHAHQDPSYLKSLPPDILNQILLYRANLNPGEDDNIMSKSSEILSKKTIREFKKIIRGLISEDFSESLKKLSVLNFAAIREEDLKNDDSGPADMLRQAIRSVPQIERRYELIKVSNLVNSYIMLQILKQFKHPLATIKATEVLLKISKCDPSFAIQELKELERSHLDPVNLAKGIVTVVCNDFLPSLDKIKRNGLKKDGPDWFLKPIHIQVPRFFRQFERDIQSATSLDQIKNLVEKIPDDKLKANILTALRDILKPSHTPPLLPPRR